ncbi:hypothetical protein GTQ40_15895 [Flavobacteriaceae bacterium R38]|nr:hypothetical protein [Flavobacteriaceae bacterium R38]
MKKLCVIIGCFLMGSTYAQENIEDLLTSGVNDAQRFLQSYLDPASEGLVHNLNNGWFNSGKAKKLFGFEIALVANASFVKDENKTFTLNTADFENLRFQDGSTSREVSTAFGDVEGVTVVVEGPLPGNVDDAVFELPTGLGSADINFVPSAFLQASIGLIKGTELKARFFPKVEADDVEAGLFGVGIQHDFTSWLPADKLIPVAISGLIAYTNLDATYDFSESSIVSGSDQRLENSTNTFLFQVIGSTRLPVINFYGGIGYITGKSETDLRGTYNVTSGILAGDTLIDPLSVENRVSGVRGTLGFKLKLGFFRFNADYTLAEYDNLSIGLGFGFR